MTVLLDGGMGQELRRRGHNPDACAAGRALLDAPTAVLSVHREFVAAGADVITTWNYAVTPQRLAATGRRHLFDEMTRTAVELAEEARAGADGVRIAGSLPPLRASYETNDQDPAEMVEEYAEIARVLAPGVDLFLCETMSSAGEGAAAAQAAAEHGKPVWVAWTLRDEGDGLLRSGETIEDAVAALDEIPVEAVLFNCSAPAVISEALPTLRAATSLPIGAYANAFTPIDKNWTRQGGRFRELRDCTPDEYETDVASWRAAGTEIIGGCCGIGPAHIARLGRAI